MTTIDITGTIGFEVQLSELRTAFAQADSDITLNLHSPGGDVYDGIAIHNLIRSARRVGKTVSVIVTGMAASIATYIACAADNVKVEDNAVWMIHNPYTVVLGDYREMLGAYNTLDSLASVLADSYAKRTGQALADIRAQMDSETWLYGQDIVTAGFADALLPAGDGADSAQSAFAVARTAFASMSRKLHERAASEAPTIDRIAALLSSQSLEVSFMQKPPVATLETPTTTPTADPPVEEQLDTAPADSEDVIGNLVAAHVQEALATERQRITAIQARCAQVGRPELAVPLIANGATLEQTNAAIIEAWIAQGGPEIKQNVTNSAVNPNVTLLQQKLFGQVAGLQGVKA